MILCTRGCAICLNQRFVKLAVSTSRVLLFDSLDSDMDGQIGRLYMQCVSISTALAVM